MLILDRLAHIDVCCGMLLYPHLPAAALPRRRHGICAPEHRCSHGEEFCLCPPYLSRVESPYGYGAKVYFRIFSIQADLGSKGTGVTVRVQRYYCTRKGEISMQFGGRSSGHDATLFEQRCETPEALRECLYSTLGVGFNDVLLFVHGYNVTLSSAEERALLLRRKAPNNNTLVGVFSFNSAADSSWSSLPLCTCNAASHH